MVATLRDIIITHTWDTWHAFTLLIVYNGLGVWLSPWNHHWSAMLQHFDHVVCVHCKYILGTNYYHQVWVTNTAQHPRILKGTSLLMGCWYKQGTTTLSVFRCRVPASQTAVYQWDLDCPSLRLLHTSKEATPNALTWRWVVNREVTKEWCCSAAPLSKSWFSLMW